MCQSGEFCRTLRSAWLLAFYGLIPVFKQEIIWPFCLSQKGFWGWGFGYVLLQNQGAVCSPILSPCSLDTFRCCVHASQLQRFSFQPLATKNGLLDQMIGTPSKLGTIFYASAIEISLSGVYHLMYAFSWPRYRMTIQSYEKIEMYLSWEVRCVVMFASS